MGLRGLPKQLKECGGVAGHSCMVTGKETHVDFLSQFFRLLNTQAFKITQQHAKTRTTEPALELPLETEEVTGAKRKNTGEHHPSTNSPTPASQLAFKRDQTLDELIEESIANLGPKNLFLTPNGLSTVGTEKDQQ
ncbi:hypothetical protein BGW39_005173, partial [Mortierella sp. 14UC]